MPQTLARVVETLQGAGVALVMPGHATPPDIQPIMDWWTVADVQEYAEFSRDLLATVQQALRAGNTVDQTVANLELPEKYKDYDLRQAKAYVEAVYAELQQ